MKGGQNHFVPLFVFVTFAAKLILPINLDQNSTTMSTTIDTTPKQKSGWWALSPLAVFLCLYLVTSLFVNDFYKVPITVAFLASH